ncbi:MAG: CPBP family intramembrane glutamic endopeptidase [Thermodesulfobacteriota bacterium]|nr:CPBP family intramembrane glutamic endopeptidase [Thermodesulfobacteriota bacterium]
MLFFFVIPLSFFFIRFQLAFFIVPLVFFLALICYFYLRCSRQLVQMQLWTDEHFREDLKKVFITFIPLAAIMTLAALFIIPELFLAFPKSKPEIWLLVMLAYPLLAAYPQEIIFRAFFFHRYGDLFPRRQTLIIVNGLSFGLAHILYGNWLAPVLSTFGGVLFAFRYNQSRSILITAIEHGLWGNFLFTVGYGWFFYSGAIQ